MHEKPGDLNFAKLKELMTHTLSSRFEVGLIAGWDSTMGFPALYRVDGIGGHIRAAGILATGSEFRQLYSSLDLNHLNWLKSNYPDGKCELDEVLDRPSHYRNYLNWFTWSTHEAAKLAIRKICWTAANAEHGFDYVTMFSVGRGGAEVLFPGTPVEEYVRNCSRPARRFKHLWIDPHQKRK
ncbi:OLC1v1037774C1 [Oldenlandia corymbosa var. corymbosa]|uniref:OLC1v1037774C1 n=1 Tax=Oldenlandia corymbosa var. corymbosa TaxID=529605 RepID=A0AAV1CY72_OLDCO|nr:OLC1v1037774C1 [Oldenlandia corymbosa var. corymbosa]